MKRLRVTMLVVLLVALVSVFAAPISMGQELQYKYGGDLVIAMNGSSEPGLIDGQMDSWSTAWLISSFPADNLAFRDYDGVVKPHLASWEISRDGLTCTLHVRQGVFFHDGTPLNAEAIKANFDRCLDPENPTPLTTTKLGPITDVRVLDDSTLQVIFSSPWALFLDTLSLGCFPIWSPTALTKYGTEEFSKHLVGTGPFILEEWVPGSHVKLVRNPDYNSAPPCLNHSGPAYVDSVTFAWITEDAVRGTVAATGQAHIVMELPVDYTSTYDDKPNYMLIKAPQPGTGLQMVMNTTANSLLEDIRIRRAILYTLDQEQINRIAYGGKQVTCFGPLNPITPCYNFQATTTVMYPRNLEKAKELLEEAGWQINPATGIREKDGEPLTLGWYILSREQIGEVVKEQLKEIGIDLEIKLVPHTVHVQLGTDKTYDFVYERERGPEPLYLSSHWNSKYDAPGGWAWSGLHDAELDRILDEVEVATDAARRCELVKEAQEIIMEYAAMVPTLAETFYYVTTSEVHGFQVSPTGRYFIGTNIWLDE